jgi:hypothetical protein
MKRALSIVCGSLGFLKEDELPVVAVVFDKVDELGHFDIFLSALGKDNVDLFRLGHVLVENGLNIIFLHVNRRLYSGSVSDAIIGVLAVLGILVFELIYGIILAEMLSAIDRL